MKYFAAVLALLCMCTVAAGTSKPCDVACSQAVALAAPVVAAPVYVQSYAVPSVAVVATPVFFQADYGRHRRSEVSVTRVRTRSR